MRKLIATLFALALISSSGFVFAHSGGTDRYGCHSGTQYYHCH